MLDEKSRRMSAMIEKIRLAKPFNTATQATLRARQGRALARSAAAAQYTGTRREDEHRRRYDLWAGGVTFPDLRDAELVDRGAELAFRLGIRRRLIARGIDPVSVA